MPYKCWRYKSGKNSMCNALCFEVVCNLSQFSKFLLTGFIISGAVLPLAWLQYSNCTSVRFCIAPCGCPGSVRSSLEVSAPEFWTTFLISSFKKCPLLPPQPLVIYRIWWSYLSHSDNNNKNMYGKTRLFLLQPLAHCWSVILGKEVI